MFKRITSCIVAAFIAAAILASNGAIQAPQAQAQIPTHVSTARIVHIGYESAATEYAARAKKKVASVGCTAGTRIGAICKDGTHSSAKGRSACSYHEGVRVWLLCKR